MHVDINNRLQVPSFDSQQATAINRRSLTRASGRRRIYSVSIPLTNSGPLRGSCVMSVSRYAARKLGRAICNKRQFEPTGFSLLTGLRIYSIIYNWAACGNGLRLRACLCLPLAITTLTTTFTQRRVTRRFSYSPRTGRGNSCGQWDVRQSSYIFP
jgi:hypothetical protein